MLIGGNQFSRLELFSEERYPGFEVVFGEGDSFREPLKIDVDEFIGVKSFKAKGKRITTFKIATIKELEPIRTVEIVDEPTTQGTYIADDEFVGDDVVAADTGAQLVDEVEVVTIDRTSENDEDPEVDEITGQMSLF